MSKKNNYFAKPKEGRHAKAISLKDNAQAGTVFHISMNTEDSDMRRMRYAAVGSKGYAPQAFGSQH